ncbi:MAG: futalosine hydrolase [Phycisphaeraceae bacterium]|nr:futalosine hydrolase [Phycisphaeraceae bacterium]
MSGAMGAAGRASNPSVLLVVAAPSEARAVLRGFDADGASGEGDWVLHPLAPGFELLVTGVGKSNAAGAVGRLLDPARHGCVVNLGVCGALPVGGGTPLRFDRSICDVVLADGSVFADEGVEGERFVTTSELGFPPTPLSTDEAFRPAPDLRARLGPLATVVAPIATVSTCAGTDALALRIAARTGAAAEAMEGAAIALVCHRLAVAFAELRVVSNTTGSRTDQRWDLPGSLARLSDVARAVRTALALPSGTPGEA